MTTKNYEEKLEALLKRVVKRMTDKYELRDNEVLCLWSVYLELMDTLDEKMEWTDEQKQNINDIELMDKIIDTYKEFRDNNE